MSKGEINGVDTAHLLFARGVVGETPGAGDYTWRASNEWVHGTHSKTTIGGYFGLGEERAHKGTYEFEADHPLEFKRCGRCRHPGGDRAGRLGELPDRRRRGGGREPRDQAAFGEGNAGGRHEYRGHPRIGPRCTQRLQRCPGQL